MIIFADLKASFVISLEGKSSKNTPNHKIVQVISNAFQFSCFFVNFSQRPTEITKLQIWRAFKRLSLGMSLLDEKYLKRSKTT